MDRPRPTRIVPWLAAVLAAAALAAARPATAAPPADAPLPYRFVQDPEATPEPELYDDAVVRDVRIDFATPGWPDLPGCNSPFGGFPGRGSAPAVDVPARLEVDGTVLENVGVRCKGNSSLSAQGAKKPLNVTVDAFVPGQDLWGFDVFNLNNGWNDPSLVREALALRILRAYMPAPRLTFARVTVDGRYVGLYQLVEQIDGRFADHWHPDDGGMVVKGDSPERIAFESSTLNWLGEDLAPYKAGYEVKGGAADSDDGYVALREMIRALDAPVAAGGLDDAAFAAGIRTVIDVDSALWYLAGQNAIANFDSYYVGKNYYLYQGRRDRRFDIIPWDQGLSFGLFGLRDPGQMGPGGGGIPPATADPFAQEDEEERPLIRRLLAVPSFRADFAAHFRTIRDDAFRPGRVEAAGAAYQDLIRAAVADEAAQGPITGAYTMAQFESNLRADIPVGRRGTIPGIVPLVEARAAFLGAHAALVSPDLRLEARAQVPEAPTAADAVAVRATFAGADAPASVELRYRVDGGFEETVPMAHAEDGSWQATIPAQRAGRRVTFALRAGLADGRAAFFPEANQVAPFAYDVAGVDLPVGELGDLVVNELLADNQTVLADEAGEFDDWIELYNRGDEPVELAGFFLSDDPADPFAFPLPAGRLGPGERLLVWADGDTDQGPLHAPFGLSRDGESVVLSTAAAVVDQIDFDAQDPDVGLAREVDGGATWVRCAYPSPGRPNRCDAPPEPTATATATASPTATPGPVAAGRTVFLPLGYR